MKENSFTGATRSHGMIFSFDLLIIKRQITVVLYFNWLAATVHVEFYEMWFYKAAPS